MVPLARGMPVALTDHIDRSPDKQLLRGRIGKVHSWVLAEGDESKFENGVRILNKLPKVVLVKFYRADGGEVRWTGNCHVSMKKACIQSCHVRGIGFWTKAESILF